MRFTAYRYSEVVAKAGTFDDIHRAISAIHALCQKNAGFQIDRNVAYASPREEVPFSNHYIIVDNHEND